MAHLTHFDSRGQAHMVDVGAKTETGRIAVAEGWIRMKPATFALVSSGTAKKGDVIGVARLAAIMAAKKTSDLIPLCHPIALTHVSAEFELDEAGSRVACRARVECSGKTGVEMEALTAVSAAALTVYDMCKALQKDMVIGPTHLVSKTGGKSGDYRISSNP